MTGNTYLGLKLLNFSTSEISQLELLPFKNFLLQHNKVTRKAKNFEKLSNKEIYFSLQSNIAKYNKPFKFISWPNFLEGHHILIPDI